MRRIVAVRLDPTSCLWCRACVCAPSVFVDAGEVAPVVPADVAGLLSSERSAIIEAAMRCPTASISVQFEDGRVVTQTDYDSRLGIEQWLDY